MSACCQSSPVASTGQSPSEPFGPSQAAAASGDVFGSVRRVSDVIRGRHSRHRRVRRSPSGRSTAQCSCSRPWAPPCRRSAAASTASWYVHNARPLRAHHGAPCTPGSRSPLTSAGARRLRQQQRPSRCAPPFWRQGGPRELRRLSLRRRDRKGGNVHMVSAERIAISFASRSPLPDVLSFVSHHSLLLTPPRAALCAPLRCAGVSPAAASWGTAGGLPSRWRCQGSSGL